MSGRFTRHFRRACALACATMLVAAAPAHAQEAQAPAGDVSELTAQLNEALSVLGRNPYDFRALFAAANAALALGDHSAAEGFFQRAEALAPGDYRIKQGLARVAVRKGQPRVALDLFAAADQLGAPEGSQASDRGLAYDLIGENRRAQEFYETALEAGADDEARMRLALSQAITGDGRASERTLGPLLARQDRIAYRTRAFALAALGRTQDAVTVAEAVLPARLAARIAPYLRYMPRLTPAQQAAAGNLGIFPRASDIGRGAAVAGVTGDAGPRRREEGARLVPQGEPLGEDEAEAAQIGQAERLPDTPLAQADKEQAPTELDEVVAETVVASATVSANEAEPEAAPSANGIGPSFDLAVLEGTRSQPPIALDGEGAADTEPEDVSLDAAFAGFRRAESDAVEVVGTGAVDLSTIQVPVEKAQEPAPPAHPRRHWVQVATGRDRAALRFDWRRIRRNSGGMLDDYSGHLAAWNETNRLLAGPFDTARAAQAMVTALKEKGIDSFSFTSAEGETVEALP